MSKASRKIEVEVVKYMLRVKDMERAVASPRTGHACPPAGARAQRRCD